MSFSNNPNLNEQNRHTFSAQPHILILFVSVALIGLLLFLVESNLYLLALSIGWFFILAIISVIKREWSLYALARRALKIGIISILIVLFAYFVLTQSPGNYGNLIIGAYTIFIFLIPSIFFPFISIFLYIALWYLEKIKPHIHGKDVILSKIYFLMSILGLYLLEITVITSLFRPRILYGSPTMKIVSKQALFLPSFAYIILILLGVYMLTRLKASQKHG